MKWEVPYVSTFDLSRLQVGKRYVVKSIEVVMGSYYDPRLRRVVDVKRYEWVDVREIAPKTKDGDG